MPYKKDVIMEIPCKDCITLGACKGKYLFDAECGFLSISSARNNCSLLNEYYLEWKTYHERITKIKTILDFFNADYGM